MFIFTDEAKKREWESLMSNGRSEKRQTTLLESMTPSKGKRRPEAPTAEVDDPQVVANGASPSNSATASTSNIAPPPRSRNNLSSMTQHSTSKGTNGVASSRPKEFYDTTSDEDEDEDEGETSNHKSRITNNNNLEPSTIAATPTTQPTVSKRKRPLEEEEDLLDDLSSGGEEELVAATELSSRTASKQRNAFVTPSTARTAT